MADKVKQEWLLTIAQEIDEMLLWINEHIPTGDESFETSKKILAKAEPLIRQDERQRIRRILENIDWAAGTYQIERVRELAQQALKGEGKAKTGEEE